jgi:phosphohistidine phosphatase
MQLYLVRHAVAADTEPGQTDAQRPLTREGAERFAKGVEALRRLGVRFDRLLHSPLLRAAETARLLQPLVSGPVQASERLANEPGPELLAEIAGLASSGDASAPDHPDPSGSLGALGKRSAQRVALVGHEPWLSQVAAVLTVSDPLASRAIEIDKGSVLWLSGDPRPGGMAIRGLYPLDTLQRLAD